MAQWEYSASNEANLMKVKYGKLIEKQFNMENVVFGRLTKSQDFVGSQIEEPVVQSIGGGVGAGSLPTANKNKIGKATLTTKKLYATVSIDRETMKAAKSDEGSFVRMTKFPVKIATKSFNRNLERILTRGDGTGALATGDGSTAITGAGSSVDPYIITFAANTNMAAFEEGDYVNLSNALSEVKEVVSVSEGATPTIGLVDIVGSTAPTALSADTVYMQNSKDNEFEGLQDILAKTSGSYKGIAIARRWQSYQNTTGGALSTALMNDVVINVKKQCGEAPNVCLTSYKQYIAFLDLLEDQKRYNLPAKDKAFKASVSFAGVEYISPDGTISVHSSRFIDDDKMLFINDKHMKLRCRPGGFEWFDEDGTVFLRESGDSYEARYGGYCDFFVNPHFQGILSGLS
jgi:hypothetical protein